MVRQTPAVIIQGDTTSWDFTCRSYPSTTWTLTYTLQITGTVYTVVADANSDGTYTVSIPSAVTATYEGGHYRYTAVATLGADRHTVEQGTLFVELDLSTNPNENSESWVKQALDAVNAVILGKATNDQQSYSIQGRSLTRYSIEDLWKLRDRLQRLYNKELAEEGLKKKRIIQSSFLT